jgi:hypothetical protein
MILVQDFVIYAANLHRCTLLTEGWIFSKESRVNFQKWTFLKMSKNEKRPENLVKKSIVTGMQ